VRTGNVARHQGTRNVRSLYRPLALRETTAKEREATPTTSLQSLLSVREELTSDGRLSSTAVVDPFGGRVVEFCWARVVVGAMVVVSVG